MIKLSLYQLEDLIARSVDCGIQQYIKSLNPLDDQLTRAEARKYVVRLGSSVAQMKEWEERGLLRGVKSGASKNSPVYYSAADIKKIVFAIQVKKTIILD